MTDLHLAHLVLFDFVGDTAGHKWHCRANQRSEINPATLDRSGSLSAFRDFTSRFIVHVAAETRSAATPRDTHSRHYLTDDAEECGSCTAYETCTSCSCTESNCFNPTLRKNHPLESSGNPSDNSRSCPSHACNLSFLRPTIPSPSTRKGL
jgi:hypothetical protein